MEFIQKQLCHHPPWELCLIRTAMFSPAWISAQHTELNTISSTPLHRSALAWRVYENQAHLLYSYIADLERTVLYCAKEVFACLGFFPTNLHFRQLGEKFFTSFLNSQCKLKQRGDYRLICSKHAMCSGSWHHFLLVFKWLVALATLLHCRYLNKSSVTVSPPAVLISSSITTIFL